MAERYRGMGGRMNLVCVCVSVCKRDIERGRERDI